MDAHKWLLGHVAHTNQWMQCWDGLCRPSPEMMSLDSSLFKDLCASICHHATWMTLLENNDPRKFSLSMPKQIANSCMCLFDPAIIGAEAGVPCSWHILEDCKKFVSNCEEIKKEKGVVVPGLGSKKGHQKENVVGLANDNHGGAQTKKKLT